ncbi:MAG: beta-ribofuranosylaminobenzene 5'-phosphate synthase family protein [Sulfurifustis sp.]
MVKLVTSAAAVVVHAPARLHMGFLDLNGSFGRRFGSLGVALRDFGTRLVIRPASKFAATGPDAERTLRCARDICSALRAPPFAVEVLENVPAHIGLGSGTQLALAVGAGVARLYGLRLSVRDIANLTGRGARSGIGVAVFEQGGFVVDGGRGRFESVPPVIVRAAFPATWRFILVFDPHAQGLNGAEERAALQRLPLFPPATAAHLCRLVLMQMLPALMERDLPTFGRAITELQDVIGDYFAPAQGGRFTSQRVARALAWLKRAGATAIGQSSWGPTGFGLVGDAVDAERLAAAARRALGESRLRFVVTAASNEGASVESSDVRATFDSARGRAGAPS